VDCRYQSRRHSPGLREKHHDDGRQRIEVVKIWLKPLEEPLPQNNERFRMNRLRISGEKADEHEDK
jgi:hypothetical protein